MAEGYQSKHINPPDFASISKASELTATEVKEITSSGGWYSVRGINASVSGGCYAFILKSTSTNYLSGTSVPDGNYVRCVTSWLYFPKGQVFYARANFTDSNSSGLFFAPELN